MKDKPSKEYMIGYGKPPKHTRFKHGNQEHLKRRRKKGGDDKGFLLNCILSTLKEEVSFKQNGRLKRDSRINLQLAKIADDAAKGDVGAASQLLDIHRDSFDLKNLETIVLRFSWRDKRLL